MKKHPTDKIGKYYLKDTCLNLYNENIDGARTQGWSEFKNSYTRQSKNIATGKISTESVHYFDTFQEALKVLLSLMHDWRQYCCIYKITPHKNVRCMHAPRTERAYNNLRKSLT